MEPIILVGGGGHCRSCIDVIEKDGKFSIAGIIDMPDKVGEEILGYPIIGTDDDLQGMAETYHSFLITIGQIRSAEPRILLFNTLSILKVNFPIIISPLSYVSTYARIGKGSIVMHGVIVNSCASIGENCIINTNSLIEHDSVVEDHCHIATGAIVNGGVYVGSGSFIGSGAVTKQNSRVSPHSFVKANSIVK